MSELSINSYNMSNEHCVMMMGHCQGLVALYKRAMTSSGHTLLFALFMFYQSNTIEYKNVWDERTKVRGFNLIDLCAHRV